VSPQRATLTGFVLVAAVIVGGFAFIDLRARQIDASINRLPEGLKRAMLSLVPGGR
jgi:hypothetical protein